MATRLSKATAISRLQNSIDQAPTQTISSEYRGWERSAKRRLALVFGDESIHIKEFESGITVQTQKEFLKSMVIEIQEEWSEDHIPTVADPGEVITSTWTFWSLIHPRIVEASKDLFDGKHYSTSVFEAFKELNEAVKAEAKSRTGTEHDGSSLMTEAFSLSRPIIQLGDLTTESGRDMQKGFMQLFLGSMLGIRNPRAHGKISTNHDQAIHFLFFASVLSLKF